MINSQTIGRIRRLCFAADGVLGTFRRFHFMRAGNFYFMHSAKERTGNKGGGRRRNEYLSQFGGLLGNCRGSTARFSSSGVFQATGSFVGNFHSDKSTFVALYPRKNIYFHPNGLLLWARGEKNMGVRNRVAVLLPFHYITFFSFIQGKSDLRALSDFSLNVIQTVKMSHASELMYMYIFL